MIEYQHGQFAIIERICDGPRNMVYMAQHVDSRETVAIKAFTSPSGPQRFKREVDMFRRLGSHPNIVKCLGIIPSHMMMVLEYLPEGLNTMKGVLTRSRCKRLMKEISLAVAHCHRSGIIHRDIKRENVMIDSQGHAKLIDFELACFTSDLPQVIICGTPYCVAPEMLTAKRRGESYDHRIDIWSMGVLFHEMMCHTNPFKPEDDPESNILEPYCPYSPVREFPDGLIDLLVKMLDFDPSTRISLCDVCQHPWFH